MAQGAFTNILPDPNNAYNNAGQAIGTQKGPGYSQVKLTSQHELMKSRTNGGRLIAIDNSHHKWNIDISYNPMTREEFEPINSFLNQRRSFLKPFKVSLPQYRLPRSSLFSIASSHYNNLSPTTDTEAGFTNLYVTNTGYNRNSHGTPLPGDIFNISDSTDSNHEKAYQVTHVETASDYQSSAPADATHIRIHFIPALQRDVDSSATLTFFNPLFRVITTNDTQEYSLGTNNLYGFSLKLEEAQK